MKDVKIDKAYLLQLAGDDRALVMGVIDEFLDEALKTLLKLQQRVSPTVQLDSVAQLLHQLKGSSASLGMMSLSKILSDMEHWDQSEWENGRYNHQQLLLHVESSVQLCKRALA